MQSLARPKGPCPNIIGVFLATFGTLVIRLPNGNWCYLADTWIPQGGLTNNQFIKLFHVSPPANLNQGWWGIVAGLTDDIKCRDKNWTRSELQAALDEFMDNHASEYQDIPKHSMTAMQSAGRNARRAKYAKMIFTAK